MWLGLALRAWPIAPLGAHVRMTVEVEPGQMVVAAGPYRWVRHPSYTGLLLMSPGSASLGARGCHGRYVALLSLPAVVRRIRVEEADLEQVLGDADRG